MHNISYLAAFLGANQQKNNMKKILALSTLVLFFASCKKDKVEPATTENPGASYTYVHTTGSYWVYDWYQVDSTGTETPFPAWKDTIRIVGDTTINGNVFQIFRGTDMGMHLEYYSRDSSGYIVSPGGTFYSYTSGPALLHTMDDGYLIQKTYIGEKQTVNTAFGSKHASTSYLEVSMSDGSPMTACGDQNVKFYRYYVSGIGLVEKEMEYLTALQVQCSRKRARLSAYYVAP